MLGLMLLIGSLAAGDAWSPVWSMGAVRTSHTATLLPGGQVLVAGGYTSGSQSTASCEMYDLATGTWRSTGTMTTARRRHAALLLQTGRVLVVGGADSGADCEVYDPLTGTWAAVGDMITLRRNPVLVPLTDGRVLAAGGYVLAGYASTATCEIYTPSTGLWSSTGAMTQPRTQHTATLLPDGRVFVAGGQTEFEAGTNLNSCEIFDPSAGTGTWTATAFSMAEARQSHTATLLDNGRVLLAGGLHIFDRSSEIFDPATGAFATTAGLSTRHDGAVSALLSDGRVLLTAGTNSMASEAWNSATWTTATMGSKRSGHTATVLPSGQVLVLGGIPDGTGAILASGEVFTPGGGTRTASVSPGTYYDAGTIQLPSGKVLAHDGFNCKEYDPSTGTWQATANGFLYARGAGPALTLLPTGKVLCVGGVSSGSEWPRVELYDPTTRIWGLTTQLSVNPGAVVAVPLVSGQVLVVGGSRCLLYDPAEATWVTTGSMISVRNDHRAALLPDGRVLVAGGTVNNGYSGSTEIYDPVSGAWTAGSNMITPRYGHVLVPLANGRIMAVGGTPAGYSNCEFFDPASGMWLPGPLNVLRRYAPNLVTLASGRLLATAGTNVDTDAPELFDIQTGVWLAGEGLAGTGQDRARAVLPSGAVLVGGRNSSGTAAWGTWLQPTTLARRPVVSAAVADAAGVTVTGSGFLTFHEGVETSPSNRPTVSWQRSQDGRMWWLAADGPLSGTQVHCALPAAATGPGWLRVHVNGIASAAVFLRIDPPSVSLSSSAAVISENGGSATLTVTASRRFELPITATIAVSGGTASAGDSVLAATTVTIPPGALTATTTLTGVTDALIETGGETVVVGIASVANGAEAGVQQATVTLTDYQSPGFAVGTISRHTTEAGQTATFTVRPSSPPRDSTSITLSLASTDSTEGVVSSGSSLVFTTGDWTTAQTVTITGIDDAIDDGDITFQIIGSASSGDLDYNNRAMPAVPVVNDDDTAGIAIAAPVGFITEGGGAATVGISLTSQPTTNVSLGLASGATVQGTVGTTSLLFTPANWNIPQQVTVTGADGDSADNPEVGTPFSLVATVTSGPGEYPTSITASRSLTCYPSNAAPTIASVAVDPVLIDEDSAGTVVNLTGIAAGGNETQVLTVTAVSSNPSILPTPAVTYVPSGATGSLSLTPVAQASGDVTVTVRVTDDAGIGRDGAKDAARTSEMSFTVRVAALNDAPALSGASTTLQAQVEDDVAAPGTLIGAILGGLVITDADSGAQRGLAVTAAETAHGSWWYDVGSGWTALGTVSEAAARLLADTGSTKVRFVPAGNYTGTAKLTIRAWDRTVGANGGPGDATVTGGSTAFSSASAEASVTITPVNDPPELSTTTGRALTAVTGGQPNPGTPVASLIAGLVSDVDGDPQGIAITAIVGTGGGGTWEGSIDSGATWIAIAPALAGGQALLLSDAGSMLVRYRPQANEAGTASLTYHAWDRSDGRTAGLAYAVAGTAYSATQATSTVAVGSGNAAPVLNMPTSLLAYVENQAAQQLDAAATVTDGDSGDFLGGTLTATVIVPAVALSEDVLSIAPIGGVTLAGSTVRVGGTAVGTVAGGGGGAPLTVAWNAAATPAAAQAVLAALSYRNLSDDPSTAVRIVRVQMTDGDGGTSFPVTVTVTVAAVNDQPVIGGTAAVGPYVEDAAPLPLAPGATIADPDSPAFASGTFSASLHANGEAGDVLAIRTQGQIAVAGGEVSYNGTVFGTVSGGSGLGTPLVVLLDADASQAAVQALLRNLTYVSTSQHPSPATRTVRLRLTDGAGGVSPDADIAVTVQPENDAPTATTVAWQVNPSSLNAIPAGNLNIADADAPASASLVGTITALPAAGTLTVNGATATVGSTFTLQDVIGDVSGGKVVYQAPAAEGTRTLSFTLGDDTVNGLGPHTLTIEVTGTISNLPPVLGLGGVATWQEALPPVAVDPNATVEDNDSPDFAGGEVRAAVTLGGSGDEVLAIATVGLVSVSGTNVLYDGETVGLVSGGTGGSPLVVSLNAAATPARVQRVVRAIGFAVSGTKPTTDQRTVQVTVRDGDSPAAATSTAEVDVEAVNSPPELRFPSVGTGISEGEAARFLDSTATCVDEDSDNFNGGQLTVGFDGLYQAGDVLAFAPTATITTAGIEINHAVGGKLGEWSGGGADSLVVVLTANATPDRVRDLLRAVTMRNTAEDPAAGTRVVQATLSDGDGGSGSAVIGVYVAPINDPPAVTIGASAITWRQGDSPIAIDPAAGCSDVDNENFAGGRLTAGIAAGADASDRLSLVPVAPIAVVGSSVTWTGLEIGTVTGGDSGTAPLVVTLDADATPDRVRDLLRCLSYASAAALPATQPRTVAIIVEDGDGGASVQRTRVVQVERVNLPPVLTFSGGTTAYTEDAPAAVVDAGATVFDGDSDDLDGGRLTIAVTGMVASDRLDIPDQGTPGFGVGRSGATVTWGGYPIGTVSGGTGEPLVVDLLAAASDERVQDLLRVVTYATTAQNPPATRTVTVVLSDGDGGTSAPVQRTVAITAVNDAPSASPTVLTVAGQTATGRWTAVDPEGDTVTWSVRTQPGNGTLTVDVLATEAWSFVPASADAGSATVRATDSHGAYADFVVPVLISGAADPRPAPASDPPLSAQIGTTWTWELAVAGDIAASPSLEVEAIGASGLVGLTVSAPVGRSVTIAWPVPGSETAGTTKRFHLRISDRSSGRSALVPVMIHLRALIGGGG